MSTYHEFADKLLLVKYFEVKNFWRANGENVIQHPQKLVQWHIFGNFLNKNRLYKATACKQEYQNYNKI